MRKIYLGYSNVLNEMSVRDYFDYDPNHPNGASKFEQSIGYEHISPEGFEVYGLSDYGRDRFDSDIYDALSPFDVSEKTIFNSVNFSDVKSMFFIEMNDVRFLSDEFVTLLGPIEIEKYDFE